MIFHSYNKRPPYRLDRNGRAGKRSRAGPIIQRTCVMLNPFKNLFNSHSEQEGEFDISEEIRNNEIFRKNALMYALWSGDYVEYFALVLFHGYRALPTLAKAQALYQTFIHKDSQFAINLDNATQTLVDTAYNSAKSYLLRDHRRKNKTVNTMMLMQANLFQAAEDKLETNLTGEAYCRLSLDMDMAKARKKLLPVSRSNAYSTVAGLREACNSLQTAGYDLKKLGIEYALESLP